MWWLEMGEEAARSGVMAGSKMRAKDWENKSKW